MIWNFKIRNDRRSKPFQFHVFAVVFTNWDRVVNNIWDHQHNLANLTIQFPLALGQFFNGIRVFSDLVF